MDLLSGTVKYSLPKPKTRYMQFSPLGSYLALWEPYAGRSVCQSLSHVTALFCVSIVTKDNPSGSPNMQVFSSSGEVVAQYIQKKQQGW